MPTAAIAEIKVDFGELVVATFEAGGFDPMRCVLFGGGRIAQCMDPQGGMFAVHAAAKVA